MPPTHIPLDKPLTKGFLFYVWRSLRDSSMQVLLASAASFRGDNPGSKGYHCLNIAALPAVVPTIQATLIADSVSSVDEQDRRLKSRRRPFPHCVCLAGTERMPAQRRAARGVRAATFQSIQVRHITAVHQRAAAGQPRQDLCRLMSCPGSSAAGVS
jgi:hypothetical protein